MGGGGGLGGFGLGGGEVAVTVEVTVGEVVQLADSVERADWVEVVVDTS
jgi:hypothetical protein